jgi:hypothetical protein
MAPDERNVCTAIVCFREESGAIFAASGHRDGSRCDPEIRMSLQEEGFLFFGRTGVPKDVRLDPADPAAPFKGRSLGHSYRWRPG